MRMVGFHETTIVPPTWGSEQAVPYPGRSFADDCEAGVSPDLHSASDFLGERAVAGAPGGSESTLAPTECFQVVQQSVL